MTKVFRNALYAPLRFPRPYNLLQRFVGASRDRAAFVRTHAVFRPVIRLWMQVAERAALWSFCRP